MRWQRLIVINIPRYLPCSASERQQPSSTNHRGCSAFIPQSFGSFPLSESPHTEFTRGASTWSLKQTTTRGRWGDGLAARYRHTATCEEGKRAKKTRKKRPGAEPGAAVREEHFHFCFCSWVPDLRPAAGWVWEQDWASSPIPRLSSAAREEAENGWKRGNKRFLIPAHRSPAQRGHGGAA